MVIYDIRLSYNTQQLNDYLGVMLELTRLGFTDNYQPTKRKQRVVE